MGLILDLEEVLVDSLAGLEGDTDLGKEYGSLTVVGSKTFINSVGRKVRTSVVICEFCSQDNELFGQGYFEIKRGSLTRGLLPCGCGAQPHWTRPQYTVLCQRSAATKKVIFEGFVEPFNGSYTKCKLVCSIHGAWCSTVINDFINTTKSCPKCSYAALPILQPKPDHLMIKSFMDTGVFSESTVFYRSSRKNTFGKRIYWYMDCPDCGTTGESTGQQFKLGQKSCACKITPPSFTYLLLIKDSDIEYCVKLGITNNYDRRIKDIKCSTKLQIQILGIWKYPESFMCRKAERECLNTLNCGVADKVLFPVGYTETTYINNIDSIIKIFEENGGIRLTVH